MKDENGPKLSWVDPELLRLKQQEKELFEEAHVIFHLIFAFVVISLVVFLLLLAILVFLYRLMMHFMRKRSLSKLLEKQAATCGRKRRVSFQYWLNPRDEEFHKTDPEESTNLCSAPPSLSISPPCQHSRQNKANTRTGVHPVPSEAKTRQESV